MTRIGVATDHVIYVTRIIAACLEKYRRCNGRSETEVQSLSSKRLEDELFDVIGAFLRYPTN
jgi:hypothetical protein